MCLKCVLVWVCVWGVYLLFVCLLNFTTFICHPSPAFVLATRFVQNILYYILLISSPPTDTFKPMSVLPLCFACLVYETRYSLRISFLNFIPFYIYKMWLVSCVLVCFPLRLLFVCACSLCLLSLEEFPFCFCFCLLAD